MRFGIFAATAGRNDGGPDTYESNLVRGIAKLDQKREYVVYCLDPNAPRHIGLDQENFRFHVLNGPTRWFDLPVGLPLALLRDDVKLYHAAFVPPPFSPRPYVFTMNGSVHFVHPEYFPIRIRMRLHTSIRRGVRKARHTICVSENVRELSAEYYGIPEDRFSVVYHGVSSVFRPIDREQARQELARRYGITRPFVLAACKLTRGKNVSGIMESFRILRNELGNTDLGLVWAGRRMWMSKEVDELKARNNLENDLIELGYVSNNDMPLMYSAAELLVFPSFSEGFGLPALEAMACGTPVVTSNNSCLPEIVGDAGVLVDPYSSEDIASGMHRILSNDSFANELREKGIERSKRFTWEKTAQQTLAAYERAAAEDY